MGEAPKLKIEKAKVLSVNEQHYKGKDQTQKYKWEIVIQDVDNPSTVVTGLKFTKLPDKVKQGEECGAVWVYEKTEEGRVTTTFFFLDEKEKGGGGKSDGKGYTRELSAEEIQFKKDEIQIKRDDMLLKLVSFSFSYTKDIMLATVQGDWNWETYYDNSSTTAAELLKAFKAQKG